MQCIRTAHKPYSRIRKIKFKLYLCVPRIKLRWSVYFLHNAWSDACTTELDKKERKQILSGEIKKTRYLQGVQNMSGNNSTLNAENAQLIKKKKKKKKRSATH